MTVLAKTQIAPAPSRLADEVQAISNWLIDVGLMGARFEEMLDGMCARIEAAGLPVMRAMMIMRTLHPSVSALSFVWRRGRPVVGENVLVERLDNPAWLKSPIRYMLENRVYRLRRPLVGEDAALDFPILEEFRGEGGTDYFGSFVPFDIGPPPDTGTGMISSWATDRPGGFTDEEIAVLERLVPRLALTVKATLTKQIAVNVLDTYVGPDAGRHIMSGAIRRGQAEVMRAVIVYTDLRGFTKTTNSVPREELVDMVDEYFEATLPPIVDRGGEILKFLGDGVLATFDLTGKPRDAVCGDALLAATGALESVREINRRRAALGKPVMDLDVALHLGDVLHGNVGARDRLDFTVIGPAVNEASRIETLCRKLGHNLLISDAFAAAASSCAHRLVPVGRHVLRGVRELQMLYTIADEG
jgi:adenylate cyclase